jgi:hypothetical protein
LPEIKVFMSQQQQNEGADERAGQHSDGGRRLQQIWNISAVIVAVEAVAVLAFLVNALVLGQFRSVAADLTLVALFAASAVWVGYTAFRLRKGLRWARSSAIFWQTAQLFIASQSFTGRGGNLFIGAFLAVTGVAVLALMFSKPVLKHAKEQVL